MRYVLGVHLGSTRVTAAVCRYRSGRWGGAEVVPLRGGAPWVDSVLHVSADGDLSVGRAALGHVAQQPERVARAPLHRTGDPVPFVLGDGSYPAETLAAGMIGWVTDRVAEMEAAHAERIVVTHPASWSAYRRGLLHEALDRAELPGVLALPAPVAAAEAFLDGADGEPDGDGSRTADTVRPGQLIAVGIIGGVHVQTALLRRTDTGVELLSHSGTAEYQAGCHLDDLLVSEALAHTDVDHADPVSMARLRASCTAAKERLSRVTDAVITETVTVTRARFEELARPVLSAAVDTLRCLLSRGPEAEPATCALVGGCAAIPLVSALAAARLPCPVAVDSDPGTALCRGAALAARPRSRLRPGTERPEQGRAVTATPVAVPSAPTPSAPAVRCEAAERPGVLVPGAGLAELTSRSDEDFEPPPGRPPVDITPLAPPRRRFTSRRRGTATDDRDEER